MEVLGFPELFKIMVFKGYIPRCSALQLQCAIRVKILLRWGLGAEG